MNVKEAVERACQEPTLVEALSFICVWECERAIKQARENYGSGANGAGWDTCFKYAIQLVMDEYETVDKSAANEALLYAREALTVWSDARLSQQGRDAIEKINGVLTNGR